MSLTYDLIESVRRVLKCASELLELEESPYPVVVGCRTLRALSRHSFVCRSAHLTVPHFSDINVRYRQTTTLPVFPGDISRASIK